MNLKSDWNRIIVARVIEVVLAIGSFGVGLWHTLKSKKLEDELDAQFMNDDSEDEDDI